MSTPRGGAAGRGGERGRGTRGGRGRGNGPAAATTGERPAQQMYTPGSRGGRGASRGTTARGSSSSTTTTRGSSTFRGNPRSRSTTPTTHAHPAQASYGGPNSTPFEAHDYANRLEHIRNQRPKLREQFIRERRMNPEGQMRLSDSVSLLGICTDMCPEFERVRRIVEDDVKPPECTPETEHLPRKQRIPDETRMVKAYARSAAGMDVELVSEIRSPKTCLKTINYLMQRLDHDEFDFLHGWIWDRTRAVRKDLRTQRIKSTVDISLYLQCLERSARFLLLSTHHMARSTRDDYSHQQDIEQLNATLMSLKERYVDNRRIGNPSENEAEFYAYRLILAPIYTNTQLENELNALSLDLRNNPRVQTAIEIFRLLKSIITTKSQYFVEVQANWKRFWDLVRSPNVSYLMACAAEVSFQRVRHVVLDTLWRVYRIGTAKQPKTVDSWTTDKLKGVLGMDSDKEAVDLCELFGFEFNVNSAGKTFLDICKKGYGRSALGKPDELKPQTFSQGIVESKRYNRAMSAVINGQSVRDAQNAGMANASNAVSSFGQDVGDDGKSLFVPETTASTHNIFNKAKTAASATSLSPAANPFIPKVSTSAEKTSQPNPFLKAQAPGDQPVISNPFLQAQITTSQPASQTNPFLQAQTSTSRSIPPSNVFTSAPSAKPAASAPGNPFVNPFGPPQTITSKAQTPEAPTATTASAPSFFPQTAHASKSQPSCTPSTAPPLFSFTPQSSSSQPPSFTPSGTPSQLEAASTTSDEAARKATEEEQSRKAEAEAKLKAQAELQRKRAQAEEQRRVREAAELAERQRQEAERERQRALEEARQRAAREAFDQQQREEQARNARVQRRESAWNSLTNDIVHHPEEGLLMQFVENEVITAVKDVMAQLEEEEKQRVWQERKQLGEKMFERQQLGMKRMVMVKWVAMVEKQKKIRRARDRRLRLKEQRARLAQEEEISAKLSADRTNSTNGQQVEATFRKPAVPASARRAKRTEERRQAPMSTSLVVSKDQSRPQVQSKKTTEPAALTPVSLTNSLTSSGDYSESYKKSTAPIDRTQTDWFELRAMGIDPSKHRKRSFGSSSGDDDRDEVETKRMKISTSTTESQQPQQVDPTMSTAEEQLVRFRTLQQSFRRSGGSPSHGTSSSQASAPTAFQGRSSLLVEKARRLLEASNIQKATPSNVQHDFGRSVPNLASSLSSTHRRAHSTYVTATPQADRPAYWNRKSRFVPQHLYGKGADAIHAYRVEYGLNSPASTRVNSVEPLAVSSPIPTQLSYKASQALQQQYREGQANDDDSVVEIDADAEQEDAEMGEDQREVNYEHGHFQEGKESVHVSGQYDEYTGDNQQGHSQQQRSQSQYQYPDPDNCAPPFDQGYANGYSQWAQHHYEHFPQETQQPHSVIQEQEEEADSDDLLEYEYSDEEEEVEESEGHSEEDEDAEDEDEDDEEVEDEDEEEDDEERSYDSEEEMDDDQSQQPYFGHAAGRPQMFQRPQQPPMVSQQFQGGNTEDDAIELSD